MASAGQAQAHSSQPMHFSSPSGQRLSWCRPWKRGAVGFFSNGYSSVTTFLNIVRKVTPNPAIGSQSCSLSPGRPVGGPGFRVELVSATESLLVVVRLVDRLRGARRRTASHA